MELLRVITVTLAASVVSLGIGSLVGYQIYLTLASTLGYPTNGTGVGAAAVIQANLTACNAAQVACSATSTALSAFTTLGGFFGIVTIALVGWYVISLFAGGQNR